MTFSRICLFCTLGAILTACSNGGTSNPATFDELLADGNELSDSILTIPYTDPSTLPATGVASYSGVMAAGLSDNTTLAGRMTLDANFSDDTISGSVFDVVDGDENRLAGTLAITDGAIFRGADTATEFTYDADIDGTLTDADDVAFTLTGFIEGDFTGPNHDYIEGFVSGTVTGGGSILDLDGGFVGEED